jgi:hypothetical protein
MVIGVHCRVKTKKNRLIGKERFVYFSIYYDFGIDEIDGMGDFLIYWKHWPTATGGMVDATVDFDDVKMRREGLIRWIEDNELREDLEDVVEAVWADIEKCLAVRRKNKYDE